MAYFLPAAGRKLLAEFLFLFMGGENMSEQYDELALWRFQVIAPLLWLDGRRDSLKQAILRICLFEHQHPRRGLVRLAFATVEEWYYAYRHEGLAGLMSRGRKDRGKSRRIDAELSETIQVLAREHPDLDGPGILAELKAGGIEPPSLSTLYRFLRAHGLNNRNAPAHQDHRAFAFDFAGDCWQADILYGPSLPQPDGSCCKTYLFAVLDDATRLICHAQFYFKQHFRNFKDCIKQALQKRGCPRLLYFDQGKIFHSRMLLHMAAVLGMRVIHGRPYTPQGRAKIERWFGTVRRTFLARIDVKRIRDLEHLNRLLGAWIEEEYHSRPHRGIDNETPLDRWIRLSENLRTLPPEVDLDLLFREKVSRRVGKDGTLSLQGKRFEAGVEFIGQKVTVQYDPFDLRAITVENDQGRTTQAFPVDLSANRRVKRNRIQPEQPRQPSMPLQALDKLEQDLQSKANPEMEENTHE